MVKQGEDQQSPFILPPLKGFNQALPAASVFKRSPQTSDVGQLMGELDDLDVGKAHKLEQAHFLNKAQEAQ